MKTILLIVGSGAASVAQGPTGYLEAYDPDAHGGRGHIQLTGDITKAKRFDSARDALECWKLQSTVHPIRESDGKPNRPLTAFTVEVLQVKE